MAAIRFDGGASAQTLRLALDMRADGISLFARGEDGEWREEGFSALDSEAFDEEIARLKNAAADKAGRRTPTVDIWLPAEQILSVETGDAGLGALEADARRAVEAALGERTSVPLSDMHYDLAPSSLGWAASAVETAVVEEAQSYAERWGFRPARVTTRFGHPAFAMGPSFAKPPARLNVSPPAVFAVLAGGALAASLAAFLFLGGDGGEAPVSAPTDATETVAAAPLGEETEIRSTIGEAENAAANAEVESAALDAAAQVEEAPAAPSPAERSVAPRGPIAYERIGAPTPPEAAAAPRPEPGLGAPAPADLAVRDLGPAFDARAVLLRPAGLDELSFRLPGDPPERGVPADREEAEAVLAAIAPAVAVGPPPSAFPPLERPPNAAASDGGNVPPPAPAAAAAEEAAQEDADAPDADSPEPAVAAGEEAASETAAGGIAASEPAPDAADEVALVADAPVSEEAQETEEPAIAEEDVPGPGAVASAPSPPKRPDALDMTASETVARVAPAPSARPKSIKPRPKAIAAASSGSARSVRAPSRGPPDGPGVAAAATLRDAIRLEEINLLGVFGAKGARRAILRLPNGEIMRVSRGTMVDGWVVSRIDAKSMRISRGGQAETLNIVR